MEDIDIDTAIAATPPDDEAPLFESRVSLRPANLKALLSVVDKTMRLSNEQFAHRMIWSLFAETPDAKRQGLFLFHVERNAPFTAIVRSRRPPEDGFGGAWEIEKRPFAPRLHTGQRLRFRVRAVASHWQPRPGAKRGLRQDVIMAAWQALKDPNPTAEILEDTAERAALEWLERQGGRCGFRPAPGEACVLDYDRIRIPRAKEGGAPIRFGAITYEGVLTVEDVPSFRRMLADGLGSARAFGNGLMQIAPVP